MSVQSIQKRKEKVKITLLFPIVLNNGYSRDKVSLLFINLPLKAVKSIRCETVAPCELKAADFGKATNI